MKGRKGRKEITVHTRKKKIQEKSVGKKRRLIWEAISSFYSAAFFWGILFLSLFPFTFHYCFFSTPYTPPFVLW